MGPLAALASLLVGRAAAAWLMEGGDSARSSRVQFDASATSTSPSQSFVYNLGRHTLNIEGTWPSLPVVTPSGDVLITTAANFMMRLPNPDLQSSPSWVPNFEFTKSGEIILGGSPDSSSTPCISSAGLAYWVNRNDRTLWGVDVSTMKPVAWAPLNITAAAYKGGDSFPAPPPFTVYADEFSLLCFNSAIWMPDHTHHGVLVVDEAAAAPYYTRFGDDTFRFTASVGTVSQAAVLFIDQGGANSLTSLYRASGSLACTWGSGAGWDTTCFTSIAYSPPRDEFNHPVTLELPSGTLGNYHCTVATAFSNSGIRIVAVDDGSGAACGGSVAGWDPVNGFLMRNQFTELPGWVSAPAVLPDGNGFRLFWVAELRASSTVRTRCALTSVKVDSSGAYADSVEGYLIQNDECNAAPIALANAWGSGIHAIAMVTQSGKMMLFPWKGYGATGPNFTFDGHAGLPSGDNLVSPPDYISCGNYMAATTGGAIIWVVHDRANLNAYLVAIARSVYGPSPTAPGTSSSSSGGSVAIAVCASLGAVVAAAAGIVFLAPNWSFRVGTRVIAPADSIKDAAGAVGGVMYAAGSSVSGLFGRRAGYSQHPGGASAYSGSSSYGSGGSGSSGGGAAPMLATGSYSTSA